MARGVEPWSHDEVPFRPPRRRYGWLGWLLFLLVMALTGAFISYVYMPLREQRVALQAQVTERDQRVRTSAKRLADSQTKLAEFKRTQEQLSGQLVQAQEEKDKIEAELRRVQSELQAKLEPEIQAGNVRIKRRGNELVVDLADEILFDSGKSELLDSGKKVLAPVAPTLARLKEFTIQVAGHTDGARVTNPATQERFPTNWELSTARATNVVRFLQESGKVPGERLVAMGFAQYRPAASNATESGRQQNRRIELVLARR
jgi:chemotaxis protein MotB